MSKRKRRSFAEEFKEQIVKLYQSGKKVVELSRDYELSEQQNYRWIQEYEGSSSFKAVDNRSDEKIELIRLRKEVQHLKMENDVLKQGALIKARFKHQPYQVNQEQVTIKVKRDFYHKDKLQVVVGDLSYIRVHGS